LALAFREKNAFVSEAAADVGCDDAYRSLIEAEAFGHARAIDVRHLRRAVHLELPRALGPLAQDGPSFQRRHRLACRADVSPHRNRGRLAHLRELVVVQGFEKDVVAPLVVDQCGRTRARVNHVDDRGQLVVFDAHLCCDIFRFRSRRADAHSDRLTYMANFGLRERPQIGWLEAFQSRHRPYRLHIREVLHHPGAVFETCGLFDGNDAGVRDGCTDECDFKHAMAAYVADELTAAGEIARVLLPAERSTDALA
jgi:hypothetical protein